jgi:hypothetical protein
MGFHWNAPALLIERCDDGSDLQFEFRTIREGTLAELVRDVVAMDPAARARLVIDARGEGIFNVGDILALSQRPSFPGG